MAIAFFGSVTEHSRTTTHSSVSFSHTVATGQSDTILVLSVHLEDNNQPVDTGTPPTYNGVALTKVTTSGGPPTDSHTEVWYLVAPATGANTMVVTLTGNNGGAGYICHQYSGVDQSSPIGATDTTGPASAASVSTDVVMTNAAGLHFHAATMYGGDGDPASITGGTERSAGRSGAGAINEVTWHTGDDLPGATGSNTITSTWQVTDNGTAVGVELLPASASQTIYTRLGQHGGPAADWPGFSAKAAAVIPRADLTRLGLYGGPRAEYPGFVAKDAAAAPDAAAPAILLHKSRLITPRLIRTLGDCD